MNAANQPPRDPEFKSGFVAIVGAPNAGKSTLLNRMLGEKISITSKKPQTTRHRILGVLHRVSAQIVFIDTPGVHAANRALNVRIVETALSALAEVDLVLVLVDVARPDAESEGLMVKNLKPGRRPVVLALNKIDRIGKESLLKSIDQWSELYPFNAVVPISATRGTQVDQLLRVMENLLPAGPPLYPDDMLTDLPQRFLVAERIREKVIRLTGQEIPYAAAVTVESYQEEKGGALVKIHAVIHVERESQKGIIIGKGGTKLKQIGQAAREDIEAFLETKVFLKLFVRVEKNWSRDTKALRRLGY